MERSIKVAVSLPIKPNAFGLLESATENVLPFVFLIHNPANFVEHQGQLVALSLTKHHAALGPAAAAALAGLSR
jgi:hypothetical protein